MPVGRPSRLIAILDDDEAVQDSLRDLMEAAGLVARCFGSAEEFLESDLHTRAACLIVDIPMPKMSGLQLQAKLKEEECTVIDPILALFAPMQLRLLTPGFLQRSLLVLCIALNSCQSHKANPEPSIEFTHIPPAAQWTRQSRHDLWTGQKRSTKSADCYLCA
jgi:CheY-like chemotaxis protein